VSWLAVAIGVGFGVLFALVLPNMAISILGLLVVAGAAFMGSVAWAMLRLSRTSSRQGAARWPPPPPPASTSPLEGPSADWLKGKPLTTRPRTRWRTWWPRARQRFRPRVGSHPGNWPPPPPSQGFDPGDD
jgi:hypothetical protein